MGASDKTWERRVLCSDGNCIGIIGSDGRCKECGRPYEGELPHREEAQADGETAPAADDTDDAPERQENETLPAEEGPTGDDDTGDDEWEQRTLCIDGSCIGVIGPDGRCKVCGKPYTG